MKQFGGKITKSIKGKYEKSPNWRDGKFQNLVKTEMEFSFRDMPSMLKKQLFERKGRDPQTPIPIIPFDQPAFETEATKIIWYGHSVMLIRINGKNILIDPMLGPDAAPIAPFKSKRFSKGSLELIEDLPEIDLLLMTHDHYDHLDFASIKKLKPKVKQYLVGLGVGRHLQYWGIDEGIITEMDWWDNKQVDTVAITYTPTRHFSGRGVADRQKSLWGGWVIQTEKEKIYFSGDGGYGDHFKAIGEKLGPFDFGIMECGQYNEHWHQIHMYPEESIQAAKDANVKKAMAVHWGGFALALHHWKDPIERFTKEASARNLEIITPEMGEIFDYNNQKSTTWWTKLT